MALQVVGAGVGRTGTHSLKIALEQLLCAPCYHMVEAFGHPDHVGMWAGAAAGQMPDWEQLFTGYAAAVDWPSASFWSEIAARYPDALVLLSVRKDAAAWWKSANDTIFVGLSKGPPFQMPMLDATAKILEARFGDVRDQASAIAAYERHNAAVRAAVPKERLLEWQPGDGWGPICERLGLPVPAHPFPHVNTTAEFQARVEARNAEQQKG